MSLRTLLTLMTLVSVSMIAAVIYTKVIHPRPRGEPSLAELRALERVCEAQCEREAPSIVSAAAGDLKAISLMVLECHQACVSRALGRSETAPGSAP